MSAASRPASLPRWRAVGVAVLCAAAGGGIRWGMASRQSAGATSVTRAVVAEKAAPVSRPLTPASLPSTSHLHRLTSLAAALPHMSVAEIAPLVAALTDVFHETGNYAHDDTTAALLRALLLRWAELDAPGMIAALVAPAFQYALDTREFAVSAWAELRGVVALKAVEKQWPGLAARISLEMLRRHPEQLDELLPWLRTAKGWWAFGYEKEEFIPLLGPERFVQLAIATGNEGYVWSSLETLAQTEPQRAMQIAKSLPPGTCQDDALSTLLDRIDFPASGMNFRAEYDSLPPGKVREEHADDYARILAEENPATALAWARALPGGKARREALQGVARAMPENASPAHLTRLYTEAWLADPGWPAVPTESFKEWRSTDPKAAEDWLQTVPDARLRAELAGGLLATSGHDLAALSSSEDRLKYAVQALFPDENEKNKREREKTDPLPTDVAPQDLAHLAKLTAAAKEGVKDEVWAAASAEDRRFLSADAMKHRVENYQVEEAVKLFESMSPEERTLGAWHEVGRAKVSQGTEKASEWMASLPQGPERDAAATALVEYLTGVAWTGGAFGRPIVESMDPVSDRDGASAFAWAASMSGEAERSEYMAVAAKVWALEDADAARAAVTASGLPEAEKQSLLRQLPKGGAQ